MKRYNIENGAVFYAHRETSVIVVNLKKTQRQQQRLNMTNNELDIFMAVEVMKDPMLLEVRNSIGRFTWNPTKDMNRAMECWKEYISNNPNWGIRIFDGEFFTNELSALVACDNPALAICKAIEKAIK